MLTVPDEDARNRVSSSEAGLDAIQLRARVRSAAARVSRLIIRSIRLAHMEDRHATDAPTLPCSRRPGALDSAYGDGAPSTEVGLKFVRGIYKNGIWPKLDPSVLESLNQGLASESECRTVSEDISRH